MGLSSSKTKTTTNQNETSFGTQMPVTPDWLEGAAATMSAGSARSARWIR